MVEGTTYYLLGIPPVVILCAAAAWGAVSVSVWATALVLLPRYYLGPKNYLGRPQQLQSKWLSRETFCLQPAVAVLHVASALISLFLLDAYTVKLKETQPAENNRARSWVQWKKK